MAKVLETVSLGTLERNEVEYADRETGEVRTFFTYTLEFGGENIQFFPKKEHQVLLDYLMKHLGV